MICPKVQHLGLCGFLRQEQVRELSALDKCAPDRLRCGMRKTKLLLIGCGIGPLLVSLSVEHMVLISMIGAQEVRESFMIR
jgi:hypothetical protein